jgi:hypothetical protein
MLNKSFFEKNNILHCKKEPGFLVKVLRVNGRILEAEVVQFPENPIKYIKIIQTLLHLDILY